MPVTHSLDDLWAAVRPREGVFEPPEIADRPAAARRYLEHAIAPATPLATAVRLSMSGEIKLRGWLPFEAEQVLVRERGFIWRATVRMGIAPIKGFDSLVDGEALMRWKLLGLIPVVNASGSDVDRSATGRFAAECVWLPSTFVAGDVCWHDGTATDVTAALTAGDGRTELALSVGPSGGLRSVSLKRWGEPEAGQGFSLNDFGALVEDERSYEGYTIPSRVRVGWYINSDRFETEGEFFRCRIETAEFK